VHGEAGVGKTALLGYLASRASGCHVVSVAGVQAEMELAFAALHQVCAPVLDRLDAVPARQREALRITFGMSEGPVPDRLLVGLGVLGLLAEVAAERPLVCVVDDEQWLDHASAQVFAFVARRLGEESVGLVFGTRDVSGELSGLPDLAVEGLPDAEARALLESVLPGRLDERVRDRIVAETRGNPLALLELPLGFTAAELAGGFGLPNAASLSGSIEESFQRRADGLPEEARRLMLLAAAEPLGDPVLLWRAAGLLEIGAGAARLAAEAGLVDFGARVRFRHPLARSAAYQSASVQERRQVHRALGEVTDPATDPDHRAWHLAQAAPGPDEGVASGLERSADRAQARGGAAAAAAFLERAAVLSPDPAQRAGRALAAAQAKAQAGAFGAAQDLLAMAEAGPLGEHGQARIELARAQLAFATSRSIDASALLLRAAKRLEPIDAVLARETYLDAMLAALTALRSASPDADFMAVARAAAAAPPPPHTPSAADLLLDGLVATFTEGYAAGVPTLRKALGAFSSGAPAHQEMRWLPLAAGTASYLWDDDRFDALTDWYLRVTRDTGALSDLPLALSSRAYLLFLAGDPSAAKSAAEEEKAATSAIGSSFAPHGAMGVAAWRGNEAEASGLAQATLSAAPAPGKGMESSEAEWANAVLHNGLGHYHEALAAAQRAIEHPWTLSNWALVELVEAAVRSGAREAAVDSHRRLAEMTSATRTDWALGLEARSHALLSDGEEAEELYRESIAHLGRTRIRTDLARAKLLYGEWLRRERRRGDAREQLHTAHQMLEAMGMEAFAERARRELRATGQTIDKQAVRARGELTAQEAQVATLARDGLSNPEIGTRLFISARTAQYHLSKVFAKLGITSRSQLDRVLP